jgi:antitoxin (DNA-binding transcriptional repressor) of toxin-antitoxin stability system
MKAVEIRELKIRLSEYLRLVRSGEEILVTDRGVVVAELRRPGKDLAGNPHPGLMKLARLGKARLGAGNRADLYPRLPCLLRKEELVGLIAKDRGDR